MVVEIVSILFLIMAITIIKYTDYWFNEKTKGETLDFKSKVLHFIYMNDFYLCVSCGVVALILIVNTIILLTFTLTNDLLYQRYQQERETLVQLLETDRDIDRFTMNKAVIEYNQKVIEAQYYSNHSFFGDYWNQDVTWDDLETIDWH